MTDELLLKPSMPSYRLTPVTSEELRDEPEFIRLPAPRARCKFCSLSRTTMVELLPHVRHVRLRKEGSSRAIILINLKSLREFLESRMSTPKAGPALSKRKGKAALV